MIMIARLKTANVFDESNQEQFDYELWKSIAEYLDGEDAYVVKAIDMAEEYVFLGLCDSEKDKELAYMMEQDSMIGTFINDREGFEKVWESHEYEYDEFFYIKLEWIESLKRLEEEKG